jgi:hypothetical protein
MIIPDADFPRGRRYGRGSLRKEPVVLKPGDVAFVSTRERLCLPWDLAGFVGAKFTYARKGVLIMTGVSVDPGFGLELINGQWTAKNDERLHFVLANVGSNDVTLKPGDQPIATLRGRKRESCRSLEHKRYGAGVLRSDSPASSQLVVFSRYGRGET